MAGILDNKTRILDTIVTELGRRQISSGKMKIEYATLTDASAYYEFDPVSGSSDATRRIYFEAPGKRKQDLITFETDDAGKLLGFPSDSSTTIKGDEIFAKDPGASVAFTFVSSSNTFASLSEGIITASIDNFNELYMLGSTDSPDPELLARDFKLSDQDVQFTLFNTHPFLEGSRNAVESVSSLLPIFMDKKLSHIPNFKFLPPMNTEPRVRDFTYEREIALEANINFEDDRKTIVMKEQEAKRKLFLAEYPSLANAGLSAEGLTYRDIIRSLNGDKFTDPDYVSDVYSQSELLSMASKNSRRFSEQDATLLGQDVGTINLLTEEVAIDRKNIYFNETSRENNIIMQMFEINSDRSTFKKLDVIDFGEFYDQGVDPVRPNKHVFFVGKIYEDDIGVPKFANLFTIILD